MRKKRSKGDQSVVPISSFSKKSDWPYKEERKGLLRGMFARWFGSKTDIDLCFTEIDGKVSVTVIVASYNYAGFLPQTLDTILRQDFEKLEVLVVDDGSTDNSVEVIESYAASDSRVRLLRHDSGINRGLKATIQLGLKEATGCWVAFCESDDWWDINHLSGLLRAVERKDHVHAAFSDVVLEGPLGDNGAVLPSYARALPKGRQRSGNTSEEVECSTYFFLCDDSTGLVIGLRFSCSFQAFFGPLGYGRRSFLREIFCLWIRRPVIGGSMIQAT